MIIQDIKGYDGKRMTVYSNLGNNFYAFVIAGKTALEILGVEADESSLMDNAAKVALVRQGEAGKLLDGYLMDKEIDLLGRYYSAIQTGDPLKIDSGKKEIIRHVVDLEAKFLRCPFGSQDKIHFYQRYKLFYWQANVLLGGRELNEAVFLDNSPGLDEKTAFAMYEGLDRTQNVKYPFFKQVVTPLSC
ncbi:MAG: hypothetical protein WC490_02470 [Candidatus Margulisiibacteriota bacterium]